MKSVPWWVNVLHLLIDARATQLIWNWHVARLVHAPELSYMGGLGMSIAMGFFTFSYRQHSIPPDESERLNLVYLWFLVPIAYTLIAWAIYFLSTFRGF